MGLNTYMHIIEPLKVQMIQDLMCCHFGETKLNKYF